MSSYRLRLDKRADWQATRERPRFQDESAHNYRHVGASVAEVAKTRSPKQIQRVIETTRKKLDQTREAQRKMRREPGYDFTERQQAKMRDLGLKAVFLTARLDRLEKLWDGVRGAEGRVRGEL